MMRKIIVISCLCGALVLTGCQKPDDKENVESVVSKDATTTKIKVDGRVVANQSRDIVIDFPIQIKSILVKEGQVVKRGDALLTFDKSEFMDSISQKEMEIEMLQLEIEKLESGNNPLVTQANGLKEQISLNNEYQMNDADIQKYKNSLKLIEDNITKKEAEYTDKEELLKAGGISQHELDDIQSEIDKLKNEQKEAKISIEKCQDTNKLKSNELQTELKKVEAQISSEDYNNVYSVQSKKIQLKAAKLELAALKRKLESPYIEDNTIIAAEDNTLVYSLNCTQGSEMTGELLKLTSLDTLLVQIDIPVKELDSFSVGQEVDIKIYSGKEEVKGVISKISEKASDVDGDMMIKADVTINKGKELLKVDSDIRATVKTK